MFSKLDEKTRALLDDETKSFAFLATIMEDGTPQLTPVWFDMDGDVMRINTAKGRTKYRNMKARPQVAVTLMKLDEPYYYLQLQGKVESYTTENGLAHINSLSQKYLGKDWSTPAGQERIIFRIKIEKVISGS